MLLLRQKVALKFPDSPYILYERNHLSHKYTYAFKVFFYKETYSSIKERSIHLYKYNS